MCARAVSVGPLRRSVDLSVTHSFDDPHGVHILAYLAWLICMQAVGFIKYDLVMEFVSDWMLKG